MFSVNTLIELETKFLSAEIAKPDTIIPQGWKLVKADKVSSHKQAIALMIKYRKLYRDHNKSIDPDYTPRSKRC